MKGLLDPLISLVDTPKLLEDGIVNEKKHLNVATHYWFCFFSITIMLSQNEYIFQHARAPF